MEEKEAVEDNTEDPLLLTSHTIQEVLVESGIPEDVTSVIERSYSEEFGDTPPQVEHLIDSKALAANVHRKREKELVQQVQTLQQKLEETQQEDTQSAALPEDGLTDEYAVILNVKPEKVDQISSQIIDGKKCLVIPIDDNEHAAVNGMDAPL